MSATVNGKIVTRRKFTEQSVPECPRCDSQDYWRHGCNSAGTRQYKCKSCGKVFVLSPYLDENIILIADRLLQEEVPVPTITIALDGFVSRRWLYDRRKRLHQ